MTQPGQRLSRPLYEGLPWIYVAGGAAALFGSYISPSKAVGLAVGILGFVGVVGGMVVLLRRRDFRALRSQYGNPDSSLSDLDEK
jgi:hypothetical protein